jgi:hypothetical protein
MQKISSYLYPNRVELLADVAGFTTEYTNVYQKTVKIYNGIDNTIEFDLKNADQKRLELITDSGAVPPKVAVVTGIELNVMDASGQELPNSPYIVTPHPTLKGIATVTIPQEDLVDLSDQYLTFSVTAIKDGLDVMLYGDTRFGATGTIQLIGNAMPTFRDERVYTDFTADIDLKGHPTYHSSAIPATFYEAVPTESLSFAVELKGFTGSVWLESTAQSTINTEAWKKGPYVDSYSFEDFTGTWQSDNNIIGNIKYFRISFTTPLSNGIGASFIVTQNAGSYVVGVRAGGTGYAVGSQIVVLGSVLGGIDGINDLRITVTGLDNQSGGASSYAVSSITTVIGSGVSAAGAATYIVTGTNYTGTVEKITVNSP